MAEMKFETTDTKPRSMLVPILLALVVLVALGAWFARVYLRPSVTGTAATIKLYPVHSVYKRPYGSVGDDQSEDALYVIADIALTDHTEVPLFLKSINGSFTMEDGTVMTAQAIDKSQLARLMAMFPKMQPLTDATAPAPLANEQKIEPGATGHGYVILSYNVPQPVWDKRKAADVTIDFYHQDPVKVGLPR